MCTELLTGTGWKSDISAMGLMLQLQNNLVEGGAKIDHYNVHDYTRAEALEAFNPQTDTLFQRICTLGALRLLQPLGRLVMHPHGVF